MIFRSLYIESLVIDAPIARMTRVYVKKVQSSPWRVPLGMDLLGLRRSPDILAPLQCHGLDIGQIKDRLGTD